MVSGRLKNKVAIITGAANGIGLKTAELFAREDACVISVDILQLSEETIISLRSKSNANNIDYLRVDISQEKSWEQIIKYVQSKYSKLDILINNAGINGYQHSQDPEHMTLKTWHNIHAVNLDSVFLGCKYAINIMKNQNTNQHQDKQNYTQKSSSIINIASRSGIVGVPHLAAYASSKAAIRNYTKSVAAYCAQKGYNIRCNTISPASIMTSMWDNLRTDKTKFDSFCDALPLKRMGEPEEIAHACLYLASDEASYTTGSEIIIDGGILTTSGFLPK